MDVGAGARSGSPEHDPSATSEYRGWNGRFYISGGDGVRHSHPVDSLQQRDAILEPGAAT